MRTKLLTSLTATALGIAGAALAGACANASNDGPSEKLESTQAALSPTAAVAYPEHDLNVPTGDWWMHLASPEIIRAKMNEGYRLIDIELVSVSPLWFTATFVHNTGVYARTGNDWHPALTEQELLDIYDNGNGAHRIVDFVQYEVGGEPRYAAVWIDNTGSQFRDYRLVLNTLETTFPGLTTGYRVMTTQAGRPIDCSGQPPGCVPFRTISALMIPNTGADARDQTMGTATGVNLKRQLMAQNDGCSNAGTPCQRLAAIHPIGTDFFYYVLETAFKDTTHAVPILQEGEQTWWAGGQFYEESNLDNPDSLEHLWERLGARFTRLVPYTAPGGLRYLAIGVANRPVPSSGSDNDDNPVLNEVDAIVARQMRRAGIPGLALGIVQGGRLVHAKGYGYSDLQNQRVTEPTDLFRIASVSKSIAKAAMIRLVRSGVTLPPGTPGAGQPLTLNTRPWGQIFEYDATAQPRPNLGDITVRDLLDHQTGMRFVSSTFCGCNASVPGCNTTLDNVTCNHPNCDPCAPFAWNATPQEWIAVEAALNAASPGAAFYHHVAPGDLGGTVGTFTPACPASMLGDPICAGSSAPWQYKNANYHMIGRIIQEVSGMSFERYVRTTMLDPLNLDRVRIAQPRVYVTPGCEDDTLPPWPPELFQAVNYQTPEFYREGAEWNERGDWTLCPYRYAASSFAASPIDILRWATSLDGSRPGYRGLDAAGWSEMGTVTHDGYLPYTTIAWLDQRAASSKIPQDLKIFYATNSDRVDRFDLLADLWNLLESRSGELPNDRDLFDEYISPPCLQNFHNLPIDEFQACFDYWVALDHWPTTLTVSQDGQRISGAFKATTGRRVHHYIPAATYDDITADEETRSSAPLHVNFVNPGGDLRATAMWQYVPAPFETEWNLTPEVYEPRWHDLYGQGFLQTDLFVYNHGGLRFASTWKKLPHDGYASHWGMNESTFATQHATFTGQGLKLVHFVTYQDGGQLRRAAIWQRVPGQYELTEDSSGAAYQSTWDARNAAGWSLHQLHSYDADSFAAIWYKPGSFQGVFSMDTPAGWQIVTGTGTLSTDSLHTEGSGSIAVAGGGYIELKSPPFSAAATREQSSGSAPSFAALDVYLDSNQPSPSWLGAVQLYFDSPAANLNHEYAAQVDLNGLSLGTFNRLVFPLPQRVRDALAGNDSAVRVYIVANTVFGAPPLRFDNLRFLP